VATGSGFPDALAGVAASGVTGGPILLVSADAVPTATQNELNRLKPGRIVVLGGTGVVSDSVASQLARFTGGGVSRLAGSDRYATGVAISSASFSGSGTVFVATGLNFPDALAGGPASAVGGSSLLLVAPTTLPAVVGQELLRLNPTRVVVLGGTGMVSAAVVNQIRALFP
jgi:putative cell wall-binding protein